MNMPESIMAVDKWGTQRWTRGPERQLHRKDGPAIIYTDGTQRWFQNGKLHREDGPASEWANGECEWYWNNLLHREDGPAVICANGDTEWWYRDVLHRENGPAVIRGDKRSWFLSGVQKKIGTTCPDKIQNFCEILVSFGV